MKPANQQSYPSPRAIRALIIVTAIMAGFMVGVFLNLDRLP